MMLTEFLKKFNTYIVEIVLIVPVFDEPPMNCYIFELLVIIEDTHQNYIQMIYI